MRAQSHVSRCPGLWVAGLAVSHVACLLFFFYLSHATPLPLRDSKCLYSGPDLPEQELCLSCLNELQNGNAPEPSLGLGQRVPGRNEDPAKGTLLLPGVCPWTGTHSALKIIWFSFQPPGFGALTELCLAFLSLSQVPESTCSFRWTASGMCSI